ncbi:MAG: VOC family protein [Candidatus Hodarchaeota archaeon]
MANVKTLLSTETVYFSIEVTNMERAKKFYQDVFKFEVTFDGGEEVGWTELDLPVAGAKLGLNLKTEGEIRPGLGKLVLVATDLDAIKAYLEKKSIKTTDITDIPDMVSYFDIYDSEGNMVQIVSDPRVKS